MMRKEITINVFIEFEEDFDNKVEETWEEETMNFIDDTLPEVLYEKYGTWVTSERPPEITFK